MSNATKLHVSNQMQILIQNNQKSVLSNGGLRVIVLLGRNTQLSEILGDLEDLILVEGAKMATENLVRVLSGKGLRLVEDWNWSFDHLSLMEFRYNKGLA